LARAGLECLEGLSNFGRRLAQDEDMTPSIDTEDIIQPRSRVPTEKVERPNPWLTIAPDEATVPHIASEDSERPSCAELIRLMTSSFQQCQRG
jgi:hypothetical protein